MRKKKPIEQPVMLADPAPAQPAYVEDWRYSPTRPTIDPESGDPVTGIAEDWQLDSADLPWQLIRCHGCNDLIATRNPEKRDTCESCCYRIRDEFYEARRSQIRQAGDRLVNPFRSGDELHELGGSLPSISGGKRK
jgi:hypothetical protein